LLFLTLILQNHATVITDRLIVSDKPNDVNCSLVLGSGITAAIDTDLANLAGLTQKLA
jgi:hypothetical protein